MLMSTVVAVALGVAPLNYTGQPETISGDYSAVVGRYVQRTDKKGVIHLSGFSRQTGAPFTPSRLQQNGTFWYD